MVLLTTFYLKNNFIRGGIKVVVCKWFKLLFNFFFILMTFKYEAVMGQKKLDFEQFYK